jgi:xanthosine utilization system XapX-like protein
VSPSAARVLHGAFIMAVLVLVVALALVRGAADLGDLELPIPALRIAVFVLMLGTLVGQRVVRAGLPTLRSAAEASAWWQAHGPRVLTIWALADGLATVGAVFWFLTGDIVPLAIGTGVGLFLLVLARPAGFEGG